MRYEFFIGLRYLRAKRTEAFISLITLISTLGLTIGVMTLNIVLAVFTGFEEDLRDRILGFNPQVVVLSFGGKIQEYADIVRRVEQVPGVVAAAPFIYGQVMLAAGQHVIGAGVRAIGADSEKVTALQRYLTAGQVEVLATPQSVAVGGSDTRAQLPALILGKGVAAELGVGVGATVSVLSPAATSSAVGMIPRSKRFMVGGLFDSGMAEYDGSVIYMDLANAQEFFGLQDTVTGIEVRVADVFRAKQVGDEVSRSLGFPFRARDWMEINHNLFAALRLGKTVYFIVLLLIVLVAAFNIISALIMVVMEKRKDIAILKSMGATRAGVRRIFVFKGMLIGLIGTVVGNVGAYLACQLLKRYHFIELPKDVYAIDTLQVRIYPEYFLAVTLVSLLICLVVTIYPARQAARLAPVDVIRYE